MDVDGDKELSPKEFKDAFFRLGHQATETQIGEIFAKFDTNRDGKMNFEGAIFCFIVRIFLNTFSCVNLEFVRMMNQRKQ